MLDLAPQTKHELIHLPHLLWGIHGLVGVGRHVFKFLRILGHCHVPLTGLLKLEFLLSLQAIWKIICPIILSSLRSHPFGIFSVVILEIALTHHLATEPHTICVTEVTLFSSTHWMAWNTLSRSVNQSWTNKGFKLPLKYGGLIIKNFQNTILQVLWGEGWGRGWASPCNYCITCLQLKLILLLLHLLHSLIPLVSIDTNL